MKMLNNQLRTHS